MWTTTSYMGVSENRVGLNLLILHHFSPCQFMGIPTILRQPHIRLLIMDPIRTSLKSPWNHHQYLSDSWLYIPLNPKETTTNYPSSKSPYHIYMYIYNILIKCPTTFLIQPRVAMDFPSCGSLVRPPKPKSTPGRFRAPRTCSTIANHQKSHID